MCGWVFQQLHNTLEWIWVLFYLSKSDQHNSATAHLISTIA